MPQGDNTVKTPMVSNNSFSIFDSIHNMVIAIDHRGRITIFNPACERAFKIPAKKALGRFITEVVPYTGLLKVLKTGKSHIGRKFVLGNNLYVANRTPIIKEGAIIGAIGVVQEVNEIQQLAEERDYYKQIAKACETIMKESVEGYLAINHEGYVLFMNETMAQLLEVNAEGAVGRHVTELIPETELHLMPLTGTQIHESIKLRGRKATLSRYPIKQEGKITGVIIRVNLDNPSKTVYTKNTDHYIVSKKNNQNNCQYTLNDLITRNREMNKLKKIIRKVARGPSTVLITGESGTGKELVAHALHAESPRKNGPFIKVNCAAVPENLLESELFGYREGAFTGARKGGQIGKFELAHGGTILLDEIGDMPLPMQAKLLRVIQEKEVVRLGDTKTHPVDVRIIASTNQDIREMAKKGKFRQDLYYRLNVINLHLPPLRERLDDLPLLVNYFLNKFNQQFNIQVIDLSEEVWNLFKNYNWPGNIRELENMIERAFNLVEGQYIEIEHLPSYMQEIKTENKISTKPNTLPALIEKVEKEALVRALKNNNGNKAKAAQELGISRAWLYKRIKYYNIKLP